MLGINLSVVGAYVALRANRNWYAATHVTSLVLHHAKPLTALQVANSWLSAG
jgi:hypothetical protein